MPIGLVGRKCGMTRVFTEDGESIPVTVIEAASNRVAQLKESGRDGYRAVQITSGSVSPTRVPKPQLGHFQIASVDPGEGLWEFRLDDGEGEDLAAGSQLGVDVFSYPGCHPRQLAGSQGARFHRPEPDPGPRVQGQEDGRADG